jgi:hypothetical protein
VVAAARHSSARRHADEDTIWSVDDLDRRRGGGGRHSAAGRFCNPLDVVANDQGSVPNAWEHRRICSWRFKDDLQLDEYTFGPDVESPRPPIAAAARWNVLRISPDIIERARQPFPKSQFAPLTRYI